MTREALAVLVQAYNAIPRTSQEKAHAALWKKAGAAWLAENPRRRKVPKKTKLAEWHGFAAIRDAEQAALTAQEDHRLAQKKNTEEALDAALEAGMVPLPGDHKVRFAWVYRGAYRSQGYGAEKYFQHALLEHVRHADFYGLQAEIDGENVYAWVADPDLDLALLKRAPGPPLKEIVRMCWASGVNPRVYYPFLPHGYEDQAGLDYFGGETKKD